MKPITQKHQLGCGLACVAFVSRSSYEKVFKKSKKEHATRGYYCRELVDLLKKSGLRYEYKRFKKSLLQENSIVFIRKSKRYPAGHYLVYTRKGWMNPWINHPDLFPKAGFNKKLPGKAQWIIYRK